MGKRQEVRKRCRKRRLLKQIIKSLEQLTPSTVEEHFSIKRDKLKLFYYKNQLNRL